MNDLQPTQNQLIGNIAKIIQQARSQVRQTVNSAMV